MNHIQQGSARREQALQQLYAIQEYSLANYADQTRLYIGDGQWPYLSAIQAIAQQQTERANEVGGLLANRRLFLQRHGFPLRFTALNDLSAKYVARQILVAQPNLIAAIGRCVDKLQGDQEGQVLACRAHSAEVENLRHLKRLLGERPDDEASWRIAA